eukprot:c8532_g1_i2.p1 GENE.c8532_g1_i2~~c8532_g1_i2.p1  ORF type:complete len:285 (+),score=52.39 c8532_g1_i2:92-946(+)
MERLIQQCRNCFVEESFWVPANAPKERKLCGLEKLAMAIFKQHTNGCSDWDPNLSGAEWWVQLRQPHLTSAKHAINFHWDKDEDLVDHCEINVHPHISTVTYLTSTGAPTAVVPFRTQPQYNKFKKQTVSDAILSWPSAGKHIRFDGRFFHGVPSDLYRANDDSEWRVTFLVNVWLNHKPLGVDEILPETIKQFGLLPDVVPINFSTPSEIREMKSTTDWKESRIPFGGLSRDLVLTIRFPGIEAPGTSLHITYDPEDTPKVLKRKLLLRRFVRFLQQKRLKTE